MPAKAVSLSVVRELALALPNVEDASSPRGMAFKVGGKLLACEAIHESAAPDSLMLRVSMADRTRLLAEKRDACYLTQHYLKYPAVLVRLRRISRADLRDLLGASWLFVSEKSALRGSPPSFAAARSGRRAPPGARDPRSRQSRSARRTRRPR